MRLVILQSADYWALKRAWQEGDDDGMLVRRPPRGLQPSRTENALEGTWGDGLAKDEQGGEQTFG